MASEKQPKNEDLAWKNRVLCSDETCIGTIGPDRRCRECGREYEGELPATFEEYASDMDDAALTDTASSDAVLDIGSDVPMDDDDASLADEEWENRILCSDDSCIGVIGPDGRCKECGKPYAQ